MSRVRRFAKRTDAAARHADRADAQAPAGHRFCPRLVLAWPSLLLALLLPGLPTAIGLTGETMFLATATDDPGQKLVAPPPALDSEIEGNAEAPLAPLPAVARALAFPGSVETHRARRWRGHRIAPLRRPPKAGCAFLRGT